MVKCRITFHPDNKVIDVERGTTILNAAVDAGVLINSYCGGLGKCGRCKVIIKEHTPNRKDAHAVTTVDTSLLTPVEKAEGQFLACITKVFDDIEVYVLESSRAGKHQILTRTEEVKLEKIEPLTRKVYLEMPSPSLHDNTSDHARLLRALRMKGFDNVNVSLELLKRLAGVLRTGDWKVTATIAGFAGRNELINIEPGNALNKNFGLAIDIGTTTVVVNLVDLRSGKVIDTKVHHNKQVVCGEDVLARINYVEEENGLEKLNRLIIDTINLLIEEITRRRVKKDDITHVVAAGNTTMTHLFLGLDPRMIRLEPYIPTVCLPPLIKAGELNLKLNPDVHVYCLPARGSYVGGDITADILASNLHNSSKLSLLIDVGTNGEVVLGNSEWIVACSCSAGPAFEGGEVEFGMRASNGAIEKVKLTDELEVEYETIGNVRPQGICGSGLIDLLAELFTHKVLDRAGKIQEIESPRVREGEEGKEFVVAWAQETSIRKDIVITDIDIKNIIRTKGAVYAACSLLLKKMGYTFQDIEQIFIAGAFGNYIDAPKAILLGLLPDVPLEKLKFIGNGAVEGARLVLLSKEKEREAKEIYKRMTYIELSVDPMFMNEYTSALFLPHTDISLFPSVEWALNDELARKESAS